MKLLSIGNGFSVDHVSVPLWNYCAYEVINKDYFAKKFHQSIIQRHRYGDTSQLLSSLMFLPIMRIKQMKLLSIGNGFSVDHVSVPLWN